MGIGALLAGVICWGVTPVLLRRLTPFIDGWTANGIRYPFAAVLYWPLLVYLWRNGKLSRNLLACCIVPALLSLGGQVFWALAHYELQASEIGFFVRLSNGWAILGSMILFPDERRFLKEPKFYVGLAIIVVGFLVMSLLATKSVVEDAVIPGGNYAIGVVFALLSSTFFGCYIVSVRYFIPTANPLHCFSVVAQFVSVGVIVGMFACGDVGSIANQTLFSWSLLISSSILGIAIGHILVYAAVQRLGASITSSCQSVLPFATVAVASIVLRETLSGWQWAGGLLMIVGALLLLSIKNSISSAIDSSEN